MNQYSAKILRFTVEFDGIGENDAAGTVMFEFDGDRLVASSSCGSERLAEPYAREIAGILGIKKVEVINLIETSLRNVLLDVPSEIGDPFADVLLDIEVAHGRALQAEFCDGANDGTYWFDGDFLAWVDSLDERFQ